MSSWWLFSLLRVQMADPKALNEVWTILRSARLSHLAVPLISNGIRCPQDVARKSDDLLAAGVTQSDLTAFISACGGDAEPAAPRGRWDPPVLRDFSARASLTLALAAAEPNNRKRSLEALQDDILAKSTAPAVESRIKT